MGVLGSGTVEDYSLLHLLPTVEGKSTTRGEPSAVDVGGIQLEDTVDHAGVQFVRPHDCGGRAAGRSITLQLDPMALAGDVQAMVEIQLFGSVGMESVVLVFNGEPLLPDMPIQLAGVGDKSTVVVDDMPYRAADMGGYRDDGCESHGSGSFDDAMQSWASRG